MDHFSGKITGWLLFSAVSLHQLQVCTFLVVVKSLGTFAWPIHSGHESSVPFCSCQDRLRDQLVSDMGALIARHQPEPSLQAEPPERSRKDRSEAKKLSARRTETLA